MNKYIESFVNSGKLYFVVLDIRDDGATYMCEEIIKCEISDSPEKIGKAIQEAFSTTIKNSSGTDSDNMNALSAMGGGKNWTSFNKKVYYCMLILENDDEISINPGKRDRGAFRTIDGQRVSINNPEELGKVFLSQIHTFPPK